MCSNNVMGLWLFKILIISNVFIKADFKGKYSLNISFLTFGQDGGIINIS